MPQELKTVKMCEKNPLVTSLPIITSTADYETSVVVKLTFIISGDHVLVPKMNW
jgi:hypothetical protein